MSATAAGCELLVGWWVPAASGGGTSHAGHVGQGQSAALYDAVARLAFQPMSYQLCNLVHRLMHRLQTYEQASRCQVALAAMLAPVSESLAEGQPDGEPCRPACLWVI